MPAIAPALRPAEPVPARRGEPHLLKRRAGWVLLIVVAIGHLLAANELVEDRFGWGSGAKPMARIEVAFVRELAQAAPPTPAADAAPAATGQGALPAVTAASAPAASPTAKAEPPTETLPLVAAPEPPALIAAPVEPAPAVAADLPPIASVAPPVVAAASTPPPAVSASAFANPFAAVAASAAASAVPVPVNQPVVANFDWPPSTRMSYRLRGNYRGSIEGRAQVDWLRSGTRYQVHLQTDVGPLLSRRISSEGELTERGLAPLRFEGEQKVVFRAPRRWTQQFGPERIVLADGREVPTLPGAQDEASQFVQLTWLFTTQPSLLRVGNALEVPLAVNRRFDRWIYEVVEQQTLHLPFGDVETFHVKPRREMKGGDLTAEIWFAPTLQYLPVRILITQDDATYVDLLLDKPPMQAGR